MNTPPANSGEKGRRGYSDHTTPDKGGRRGGHWLPALRGRSQI